MEISTLDSHQAILADIKRLNNCKYLSTFCRIAGSIAIKGKLRKPFHIIYLLNTWPKQFGHRCEQQSHVANA